MLSVWGDPDVGIGTFYMILEPLKGSALPSDVKVNVAVQPVSGRLPEARYSAERDRSSKSVQTRRLSHSFKNRRKHRKVRDISIFREVRKKHMADEFRHPKLCGK